MPVYFETNWANVYLTGPNNVVKIGQFRLMYVYLSIIHLVPVLYNALGPCGSHALLLQNRPNLFPGWMALKAFLNQGQFGFVRFSCLGFCVVYYFNQPSLSGLLCQVLASQAVSNDANVEEQISTKTWLHEGPLTFKQSSL